MPGEVNCFVNILSWFIYEVRNNSVLNSTKSSTVAQDIISQCSENLKTGHFVGEWCNVSLFTDPISRDDWIRFGQDYGKRKSSRNLLEDTERANPEHLFQIRQEQGMFLSRYLGTNHFKTTGNLPSWSLIDFLALCHDWTMILASKFQ